MKKSLLTIVLGLGIAANAFSQGQINFNNTTATLGRSAPVTFLDVPGRADGSGVIGQNYVAQLFYASSDPLSLGTTAAVSEAPALFRIETTANPGTWAGGARTLSQASGVVNLVVRCWDISAYPSYAAAYAAGGVVGQSASFSYDIPTGNPAPSQLVMNNFQGFSISPIPEPSTIALGVLGAGSLLFLRRKK